MYVEDFFKWEGWTAISSICQVLIALFAFVAICITLCQIGNRKKMRIDIKLSTQRANIPERTNEKVAEMTVEIFNYGLSPIFIKGCWISFYKKKVTRVDNAFVFEIDKEFIRPGECKTFKGTFTSEDRWRIGKEAADDDYIYVFIESGIGKIKRIKTSITNFEILIMIAQ